MNSVSRKLRKLRRDPIRFFRDTWWFRRLASRELHGAQSAAHARVTSAPDRKAAVTPPPKAVAQDAAGPRPQVVAQASKPCMCNIGVTGKIDFNPSGKGAPGVRTALLLPSDREHFYSEYLAGHSDFSPLQLPSLSIGYFDAELELQCDELDLINRIPQSAKKKLEALDTVLLVDAPSALVNVIGACATHLRVISLVTDELLVDGIDTRLVAGVVFVGQPGRALGLRVLHCPDLESVYPQLRRLISENARKDPNMLLAIRGGLQGFTGITDFDTTRFGGVVFCKSVTPVQGRRFVDYLDIFDRSVVDLFLTESVYLRYKTLCEPIEAGGSSTSFFAKALADGVTFDVRESQVAP